MAYRPITGFTRYLPQAYKAARKVGKVIKTYRNYQEQRQNRQKANSGRGVTANYDKTQIYSRKKMPRRKKRVWKKFSKKVNWVIDNRLGTKDIVFNKPMTIQPGSGAQGVCAALLYGKAGDPTEFDSVGQNDLTFLSEYTNGTQSVTDEINGNDFAVTSAILDVTLTNTSPETCPMEVDIYEVMFKNEVYDNALFTPVDGLNPIIGGTFPKGLAQSQTPFGTSALTISTRGCTPFNWLNGIKQSGMTISSKKKFFLPTGSSATYQIRDSKNRVFSANKINEGIGRNGWVYPYATRGIIIISKQVAGFTTTSHRLAVGVTRNYKVKQLNNRNMYDGYVAG